MLNIWVDSTFNQLSVVVSTLALLCFSFLLKWPYISALCSSANGHKALSGEYACKPVTPVSLTSSPLFALFSTRSSWRKPLTKKKALSLFVSYLPAGLWPDPVLPPWTEQSLTGPRPCPESCDHECALPTVQRWPWWTPGFTFSSDRKTKRKKNSKLWMHDLSVNLFSHTFKSLTPDQPLWENTTGWEALSLISVPVSSCSLFVATRNASWVWQVMILWGAPHSQHSSQLLKRVTT